MTGEVYIHYGADAFDPSHGFPVVNTKYSWVKPHGGLWASRKRASYGWAKWCEENSFRDCAAEPSFQFIMRNPEKVAVIHNLFERSATASDGERRSARHVGGN